MTGQNIWTGRADISIAHKTISTINGISNAPRWWLTQIQDVSHLKRSKSRIDNCVWKKESCSFHKAIVFALLGPGAWARSCVSICSGSEQEPRTMVEVSSWAECDSPWSRRVFSECFLFYFLRPQNNPSMESVPVKLVQIWPNLYFLGPQNNTTIGSVPVKLVQVWPNL